jgi:hypothetical protein
MITLACRGQFGYLEAGGGGWDRRKIGILLCLHILHVSTAFLFAVCYAAGVVVVVAEFGEFRFFYRFGHAYPTTTMTTMMMLEDLQQQHRQVTGWSVVFFYFYFWACYY